MITIAEQVRSFEKQIVAHSNYCQAYSMIEMAVESTRLRGIPTSAVLIGPSGAGKTTLVRLYQNTFPAPHTEVQEDGIHAIIPAFYCTVPAKVTLKSFCKAILTALGCDDLRGDTVELNLRIERLLKTCQVEIVIFDEFQILADPENEKQVTSVINWLLSLVNRISIPVIIVGTEGCKEIIYKEDRLARRFPHLASLHYLRFELEHDSNYMVILRNLDEKFYTIGGLDQALHLTDPSIAARLYVATRGNLEYIRQILSSTLKTCIKNRNKGPTLEDFQEACNLHQLNLCLSKKTNPFNLTLAECIKLIEEFQT